MGVRCGCAKHSTYLGHVAADEAFSAGRAALESIMAATKMGSQTQSVKRGLG